ncbi:Las1-like-domain-containing protein [Phaeosphaeriaceae sp. PMI808]|nr:Las1-like-domain-containing protein [Phaeosphaeriaceae sp. PMI808]
MDARHIQFVVTPWRHSQELFHLRRDLYGSETIKRERAINKIFAWRSRKQDGLPLLLDSTADIVDVILQDEKNELKHNALRLLYATALSRFITGLADTQIELTRDKPSWFPPGKSLQLPLPLLELRHHIVHRHLPSLAELKIAAQDSLDWLWEWYWSQLDHAFSTPQNNNDRPNHETTTTFREKLQSILKTYLKDRKAEIKSRKTVHKSSETALSIYALHNSNSNSNNNNTHPLLLTTLLQMILPTDKKLGSSMSGAFLIWDPLLLALCTSTIAPQTLLDSLLAALHAPRTHIVDVQRDPVREGMCEWIVHVLTADVWAGVRTGAVVDGVLETCFLEVGYWDVRVLERKKRGPQRVEAWKVRPIGWVDGGYEDDE